MNVDSKRRKGGRRQRHRQELPRNTKISFALTRNGTAYLSEQAKIKNASEGGVMLELKGISESDFRVITSSPGRCTMVFNPPLSCGVSFLAGETVWFRCTGTGFDREVYCGVRLIDTAPAERDCFSRCLLALADAAKNESKESQRGVTLAHACTPDALVVKEHVSVIDAGHRVLAESGVFEWFS